MFSLSMPSASGDIDPATSHPERNLSEAAENIVRTDVMSCLKRKNVVSFWGLSPQTHKESAPGTNQKWREKNLRKMLCRKYQ